MHVGPGRHRQGLQTDDEIVGGCCIGVPNNACSMAVLSCADHLCSGSSLCLVKTDYTLLT